MTRDEKILEQVRVNTQQTCYSSINHYPGIYNNHLVSVVKHAKELALDYGVDPIMMQIAAWLHDIGSVLHGRKDHHITGAKIADELLTTLGYDREKIEIVKNCILKHRGSQKLKPETDAELILAEADALANLDSPGVLYNISLVCENKTPQESDAAVWEKVQNKWAQISLRNKHRVLDKYNAYKTLLGG